MNRASVGIKGVLARAIAGAAVAHLLAGGAARSPGLQVTGRGGGAGTAPVNPLSVAALLAGSLAIATPAFADDGYPPAKYDIGGQTEEETRLNYYEAFGSDAAPLIAVPYGQAKAECDKISLERWGIPYTAGNDGELLVGCLLRNEDLTNPVIVYSRDSIFGDAEMANRILRHEIGHLLGWPGDHPR